MPIPKSPYSTGLPAKVPTLSRTNFDKGELYLQLSLKTLDELTSLSECEGLSADQKASYDEACRNGRTLSAETIRIRDRLLTQKKSFPKFLVNLFVRESSTKHFYKVSYRNYSSIRKTSDDLNRLWLPEIDEFSSMPAQGNGAAAEESLRNMVEDNLGINLDVHTEQVQETRVANSREDDEGDGSTRDSCDVVEGLSLNENTQDINCDVHTEQVQETRVVNSGEDGEGDGSTRDSCDVVEGGHSAEGLSPNENTQDINLNVYTEQDVQETFAILNGLGIKFSKEEDKDDDDDDGSETIRPSPSPSRAPSPSPSCTINIFISQSVVSFDSESTGTTLNVGVNQGVGSA